MTKTETNEATNALMANDLPNLMEAMDAWRKRCLEINNTRINNSVQGQVYDLIRYIHQVVEGAQTVTYDLKADDKFSGGKRNVWYALAYYMKLREEKSDEFDAIEYAAANWKSIRSAVFSLQSTTIGVPPTLYACPHAANSLNTEVVTFNGGYLLRSGKTVSEVSGEKENARWKATLTSVMRRRGVSAVDAVRIANSMQGVAEEQARICNKGTTKALEA